MHRPLLTITITAAAGMAQAQDCGDLGLSNTYLAEHFCTQLDGIAGSEDSTRSVNDGSGSADPNAPLAEWAEFEVLQEAYRADPKKTLELIARIKKAGGLSNH